MQQPENKFKTYDVNGRKMIFNAELFGDLFTLNANKNSIRYGKYEILLSEKLNVSKDTVHGWRFKKFAPGDIELVKTLAAELGTDFEKLLKEKREMSAEHKKFNDVTKMKVAEVYKILLPYFEDCRENLGEFGEIARLLECTFDSIWEYCLDSESAEEEFASIKDWQNQLNSYRILYSTKAYSIKRELKLNMLELPEFIFEKWMTQVTELSCLVKAIISEIQDLDININSDPYWNGTLVIDINNGDKSYWIEFPDDVSDSIFSCYNEFIQFCKEEIWPLM